MSYKATLHNLFKDGRPEARPFSDALDWIMFSVTLLIGAAFTYYVKELDLMLILVDQFSHLSMGRQIIDSLTPGMSQVGFWPPLLHVLLTPFVSIDALYYSGLGAAFLLVPVLGCAQVFLARTLYLLTEERLISYLFAGALLLNPYILYFSVTPMMEMLFLSMLFGTAYFFSRWWMHLELSDLILTGVFIALASLARFEGFLLVPLVGLLMLVHLIRMRRSRAEIEALALLFGLVAATGIIFTLIYGFTYNDDPLAFASNNWGAYTQQRELVLPGEGDITNAVLYMGAAAVEMVGPAPLAGFLVGLAFLAITLLHHRFLIASVIAILLSPYIFDVLAVYQGSAIIYTPYLPPYPDTYFNVRYGIFIAGATIFVPAVAVALIAKVFRDPNRTLPFHLLPAIYVLAFVIAGIGTFASSAGCADCFTAIRNSQQASPEDHATTANALSESYDGGYILMTRALHNEVAVRAGIPLRNYILEANEHYYGRAVEAPWFYARYVVMFNPNDSLHPAWQQENELVSKHWAGNEKFLRYYEPIFNSEGQTVYELSEPALRAYLARHNIPTEHVPSLSRTTRKWDVEETHAAIETALRASRIREELQHQALAPPSL